MWIIQEGLLKFEENSIPLILCLLGYILGEFGHLIADDSGSGPEAQLACLQSKFGYCTNSTRGLLLNTFGKFASEYPEELGARLSDLLQEYRRYL